MPTVYFIFYVLAVAGAYIFRLGYLGWFGAFFFYSVAIMPVFILLLSLPGMLRSKMSLSIPYTAVCGSAVQLCISTRTAAARQADRIFADQERIYRRDDPSAPALE